MHASFPLNRLNLYSRVRCGTAKWSHCLALVVMAAAFSFKYLGVLLHVLIAK